MRKFILLLSALLGACGQPSIRSAANMPIVENRALPPPTGTDMLASVRPYLIGPFDKLSISVFGIEDLSSDEVQADAGGRISFPLIGTIDAAGLTPAELEKEIERRLAGQYVRDPQVTVNLKETLSQVITVDGQVQKPGLYPVIGKMTLMRAVATAGGTSEFAKLDNVVVFRTVAGQEMAGLYNLGAIRAGAYKDPEVFANDVIVIGDSQAKHVFKDLLQATPLFTTPLLLLFRKN